MKKLLFLMGFLFALLGAAPASAQVCNFSGTPSAPIPPTISGSQITTVTAFVTGDCDNWLINVQAYNDMGENVTQFGSETLRVSAGARRVALSANSSRFPASTTSQQYYFEFVMGDESVRSPFLTVGPRSTDTPPPTAAAYGCVAGDGRYACSPGVRSDCSDIPASTCPNRTGVWCYRLDNAARCGLRPNDTVGPTPPPGSGRGTGYDFRIDNPLGNASDLMELIRNIAQWIFNLAIPVGVIMIIVGGIQFLMAGANPDMASRGKTTLKYAVIGLAIVFIGYGFVTLVQSIIALGGSSSAPTQTPR